MLDIYVILVYNMCSVVKLLKENDYVEICKPVPRPKAICGIRS